MSDEKVPYIKRLEIDRDVLLQATKSADRYVNAMKRLHTTNYDRPSAGKEADMAYDALLRDIETAKAQLGGRYA